MEIYFVAINLITFCVFGYDKKLAEKARWHAKKNKKSNYRVSEKSLHTLQLLGGSPGSLVAMAIFRHKIKKKNFLIVTSVICFIQLGLYHYATKYII